MDAIEMLVAQHRTLEQRLGALVDADESARAALLAQAADELSVHVAAEEEVFYPAVRAVRTEDVLLESLEEHLSLKRLLADLLELPVDAPTFEAKCKVLREQAEHHHEEEEENLFPKARKLLGDGESARIGDEMAALQQRMARDGEPREAMAEQTDQAAPLK